MKPLLFHVAVVGLFLQSSNGLPAQDTLVKEIPIPNDAKDVSYSRNRGDIRFRVPVDMKVAGEYYKTELAKAQWSKSKKDNLQKSFWVQTYNRGQKTLEVRTDNRDGGCEVRLTPSGLLWDEDLAPKVKDIPIPPDATALKFDPFFETIEFQHPQSTQELADFFTSKIDSKIWSTSGTDSISDRSVTMKREAGKASLQITITNRNDSRQVDVKTKGMVWDGIKKTEVDAKKSEAGMAKEKDKVAAKDTLPERKAKPSVGMDQLEKLTSKCALTLDGTAIPLTEIIAYEVISYGKWNTHIIATAAPIKQDALLSLLQANVPEQDWGQKWKLPSPFVKLVLNDQDKPDSMQLLANQIPGSESGSSLRGNAAVEGGRARGTVSLPKGKFFKHEFSVEFTFDVGLISKDAQPKKLLANASKLETNGKIILQGKTISLANAIAYQSVSGDETVTHILLTEKALDVNKVKASLAKSGDVDSSIVGFQPQIDLTINQLDQVQFVNLWCDGISLNMSSNDKFDSSIQTEKGRVRGTAKLRKAEDLLGKSCDFQTSFDLTILPGK